jgi:hypothetical protein
MPGQPVTISYIDQAIEEQNERRKNLATHYFFTCLCQRCDSEFVELQNLTGLKYELDEQLGRVDSLSL